MESKPKHKSQLDIFLEGVNLIFKNWTALRLCIDNNATLIFNNYIEVVNDQEEIYEELEFNIKLGEVYDSICDILTKEKSTNFQEQKISEVLKKFIDEYFYVTLEDESNIDISRMIVKLFNEISIDKDDYINKLKLFKHSMQFNIVFPIKPDTKINLDDYESCSDEDEATENEETEEEKKEMKDIVDGKFKNKKKNNDIPLDVIHEINKMDLCNEDNDEGFEEVKKGKC